MTACRFKQSKETILMYSSQFYVSSHLQYTYPITAVGLEPHLMEIITLVDLKKAQLLKEAWS